MRIAPMVVAFWTIALVIGLLQGTTSTDMNYGNYSGSNATNGSDAIKSIYESPTSFYRSIFFNSITALVTVGGLVAVGLGVLMKSDMVLLAGILGLFGSLIVGPMEVVWSFIRDEMGMMLCGAVSVTAGCLAADWITSLILGSLAIVYLMAVIEWWTSRPLTR